MDYISISISILILILIILLLCYLKFSTKEKTILFTDNRINKNKLGSISQRQFNKDVHTACKYIIKEFFSLKRDNSLNKRYVVGVEGPWGVGKTTFINKLIEVSYRLSRLKNSDLWYEKFDKNINIIKISSLSLNSNRLKEDLINSILGSKVSFKDKVEYINKFSPNKTLGVFAILLTSCEGFKDFIYKSLLSFFTVINVIILTKLCSLISSNLMLSINVENLVSVTFVFIYFCFALWIFKSFIDNLLQSVSNKSCPNEQKRIISSKLEDHKKRFICIIDDIDRLPKDKVYQLFISISEIIDFSNILFILAYDRSRIDKMLKDSFTTEEGESFLDKIIDYEFNIQTYPNLYVKEQISHLYNDILISTKKGIKHRREQDFKNIDQLINSSSFTMREVKKAFSDSYNASDALYKNDLRLDVDIPAFILIKLINHKNNKDYKKIINSKHTISIDKSSKLSSQLEYINKVIDTYKNYEIGSNNGLVINSGKDSFNSHYIEENNSESAFYQIISSIKDKNRDKLYAIFKDNLKNPILYENLIKTLSPQSLLDLDMLFRSFLDKSNFESIDVKSELTLLSLHSVNSNLGNSFLFSKELLDFNHLINSIDKLNENNVYNTMEIIHNFANIKTANVEEYLGLLETEKISELIHVFNKILYNAEVDIDNNILNMLDISKTIDTLQRSEIINFRKEFSLKEFVDHVLHSLITKYIYNSAINTLDDSLEKISNIILGLMRKYDIRKEDEFGDLLYDKGLDCISKNTIERLSPLVSDTVELECFLTILRYSKGQRFEDMNNFWISLDYLVKEPKKKMDNMKLFIEKCLNSQSKILDDELRDTISNLKSYIAEHDKLPQDINAGERNDRVHKYYTQ